MEQRFRDLPEQPAMPLEDDSTIDIDRLEQEITEVESQLELFSGGVWEALAADLKEKLDAGAILFVVAF